ncbi:hypothetical protein HELRODRAFT_182217 [Helobdella robusta]|uniref:Uncharacterized protein n=1 Tax=Helobdella robusta TaxID=6412 RepID=T1FHY1_HELRO|nr:hypothetical protein HELRODRAFT_182217 [Helobdella robusta]ESN91142.1 hypothetical protein HELRODRAFT_182217 [Helobdella robusta]
MKMQMMMQLLLLVVVVLLVVVQMSFAVECGCENEIKIRKKWLTSMTEKENERTITMNTGKGKHVIHASIRWWYWTRGKALAVKPGNHLFVDVLVKFEKVK